MFTLAVKPPREQHCPSSDGHKLVVRRDDTRLLCKAKCNLFPGFDAVVVSVLRKLRDRQVSVLVDDGGLGSRAAQRGTGSKDELEVFIGLLVTHDAVGRLQQISELDQGRDTTIAGRRLEDGLANLTKTKGAKACLVRDAQKIIAFEQGSNGAAFPFRLSPC